MIDVDIVGAGFSGSLLALHILRESANVRVFPIEKAARAVVSPNGDSEHQAENGFKRSLGTLTTACGSSESHRQRMTAYP